MLFGHLDAQIHYFPQASMFIKFPTKPDALETIELPDQDTPGQMPLL